MGKRKRRRDGRTPVRDFVRIVDGRVDYVAELVDDLRRDLVRADPGIFNRRATADRAPDDDDEPGWATRYLELEKQIAETNAAVSTNYRVFNDFRQKVVRAIETRLDALESAGNADGTGSAAVEQLRTLRAGVYEELAAINRRLTDLERPADGPADQAAMLQTAVEALQLYADDRYWDGDRCPDLGNLPAVHALRTIDEARAAAAAGTTSGKRSRR